MPTSADIRQTLTVLGGMLSRSIRCCYRGCTLDAWATRGADLEVVSSSGTCLSCRRVALCLPHLLHQFEAGSLRCSHCAKERWSVTVFADVVMDPALADAVRSNGGRIENLERRTPARPGQWLTFDAGPNATHPAFVYRRLSRRLEFAGALAFDKVRLLGELRDASAAPDSSAFVVESAGRERAPSQLTWWHRDGRQMRLPNPHQRANHGPVYMTVDRFAFLCDLPGGRSELRLAHPARSLVEDERVIGFERHPPLAPVRLDDAHVLVFAPEGRDFRPTIIDVIRGEIEFVGEAGAAPRLAAGGGGLAAWVDQADRLHAARKSGPVVLDAVCDADHLAVDPAGQQVAWISEGALEICTVATGERLTRPAAASATAPVWQSGAISP